ncbi:MAG: hypothetical protein OEZ59_08625 [Deltaproteobacteria bacterium]|nr:hypothetical protein [Deltaproteobacteria bacterium]
MAEHNSPALGIGLDTGGTFTDIVLFDLEARSVLRKAKTPTTHGDYTLCIGSAFAALAVTAPEQKALRRVCLSTTLATNTVAEGRTHPTALVMEPGDIHVPPGFHPRLALLGSQMGFDAVSHSPVSEREVLEKTRALAPLVEGFAVSGYGSTRNPDHERRIGEILGRAYGKPVVLGSELTRQLNFLQRARAAALNAGLLAVVWEWLRAVQDILAGLGIGCPLYIVKGDGSLMEQAEALQMPVQTLFSGPAASLRGGAFLVGGSEALVVDVGGTTTDIGLVRSGRGLPSRGGVLVGGSRVAVEGLDIRTFGLGGDSRFTLRDGGRFRFESSRVLPFCRAGIAPEALEKELEDCWHFGDPELLELAGLTALATLHEAPAGEDNDTGNQPEARRITDALAAGPRRVRALGTELKLPRFASVLTELLRRRRVIRIGLTPTDLLCARGLIPAFSRQHAAGMLGLYARMLDLNAGEFQQALEETLRLQAAGLLLGFLLEGRDPSDRQPAPESLARALFRRDGANQTGQGQQHAQQYEQQYEQQYAQQNEQQNEQRPESWEGPALDVDPGLPVVLVGAGAPLLFGNLPGPLGKRVVFPEHGDVANALGAVTSEFVLRERVSIEPVYAGGVELFDHEGKTFFADLATALQRARALLKERLEDAARRHRLGGTSLSLSEEIIEDYADYSRRTRRELVIAHVEGVLTGMPE